MDISKTQSTDKAITITAQQRGEVIAYAVQNFIYNVGANIYEPYINLRAQRWWDPKKSGTYSQNFWGELTGDIAGGAALIVGETLAPQALHTAMRAARKAVHPLYTSVAHWTLSDHKHEPDYAQQVERWTLLQERNLVRGAFTATVGMATNMLAQHLMGNKSNMGIIFVGKFASRMLTTTLGFSARFAFPEQFKSLDRTMSKHLFAPLLDDSREEISTATTHAEKLLGRKLNDTPDVTR